MKLYAIPNPSKPAGIVTLVGFGTLFIYSSTKESAEEFELLEETLHDNV